MKYAGGCKICDSLLSRTERLCILPMHNLRDCSYVPDWLDKLGWLANGEILSRNIAFIYFRDLIHISSACKAPVWARRGLSFRVWYEHTTWIQYCSKCWFQWREGVRGEQGRHPMFQCVVLDSNKYGENWGGRKWKLWAGSVGYLACASAEMCSNIKLYVTVRLPLK